MIGGNGSLYAVLTQGDCSFEENEKWEEEIANNKAKLNETIDKIAKAFGLRPAHQKDTERAKPARRQPCKKNNMER